MDSTIVQWSAGGIFVLMFMNTVINMLKKRNGNGSIKEKDFCRHEKEMKQFFSAVTENINANTQVLTELSFKTDAIYKKIV